MGVCFTQPGPALPDGQGAVPLPFCPVKHTDGRGHSGKHIVFLFVEELADVPGGIVCDHLAAIHHDRPVRIGENILQPVLCDDNGSAKLRIDLTDGVEKIRCGNGVKLAGRLVQNQNFRLHCHNGSKIQKLLLTAGEGGNILMKPILDAEIASHLRHPGAHGLLVAADGLQTECQLMPYLIRYDLIVGILHDITNFGRLVSLADLFNGCSVKQDLTAALAVRGEDGFQVAQ